MTTHTGYVMTLANSIIGVSLLAMPYCFKQCGIILGILLLTSSNIVTRLACYFLLKSAMMCRRKNFEFVAYHAFGTSGKFLVEVGVIGFLMGTGVAFFVVIGDLAPAIISKIFELVNDDQLRTVVLLVTGLVIILPLSLIRNIESLAVISTFSMLFYFLLLIKMLTESFPRLVASDWTKSVNLWRPEGVLQCFPIFAVALSCQTQVFEIMEVLPNPTLEQMTKVVRSAVGLCTFIYIINGCLGYIAYSREPFGGNILLSFSPSLNTDIFQLGFVVSVALSFPIVVFPCRASLNSLLCKQVTQYHELTTQSSYIPDSRFKFLTVLIVGFSLFTGLLVPNVEFVLGFVCSTIGVAISLIFPACAFVYIQGKETNERLMAKVILVIGIVAMILGTYSNLEAAAGKNDVVPAVPPSGQVPLIRLEADLKPPNEIVLVRIDGEKNEPPKPLSQKKESPLVEGPPDRDVLIEKPNTELPRSVIENAKHDKTADNSIRREPPLPAALIEQAPLSNLSSHSPANNNNKKDDIIHQDAIAKEEHELKEHLNPQKQEEEENKKELLETLQQHQKEQKELLKEQQNILDEMKNRNSETKFVDQAKDKPLKVNLDSSINNNVKNPVEPISPQKFIDNIVKIQEVIDDLKEKKQIMDKNKGEKIAEDKKRIAEKKSEVVGPELLPQKKLPSLVELVKNITLDNPINYKNRSVEKSEKNSESKIPGRDILVEKENDSLDRAKRDVNAVIAEDGSCEKLDENKEELKTIKANDLAIAQVLGADGNNAEIQETKLLSHAERIDLPLESVERVENHGKVIMDDIKKERESVKRKRK